MTNYSTLGLRGFGLAAVLLGWVLMSAVPLATAETAETAAAPAGSPPAAAPTGGSAANPFSQIPNVGLASAFTSCKGSTIASAAGTTLACFDSPPGDLKEVSKNLSCEAFGSAGSFSYDLATRRQKEFETMLKGVDCEKSKLDAAGSKLQCLSQQAGDLSARIGMMSGKFKELLTQARTEVGKYNSQIIDRKEQQKDLIRIIGGDGETGDDGLLGAKKSTEELLSRIQGDMLEIKNRNREVDNDRGRLSEQAQSRTMALATECFDKRTSPKKCVENGSPVKVREWLLCRSEQAQYMGPDGKTVNYSELNKSRARSNRAALEQLLNEIFSDAPKNKEIPMTAQQMEAYSSQAFGILMVEDIERRYGSRLADFNEKAKGLKIKEVFFENLRSCFTKAENTVKGEWKRKSSQLGIAKEMILAKERANEANTKTKFQEYNQVYSKAKGSITRAYDPLVLTKCEGAKTSEQEYCFEQIESKVRGLLMGTNNIARVTMVVHGTNGANRYQTTCYGINGCIKSLQNRNAVLKTEIAQKRDAKRTFVRSMNNSAEMFVERTAQSLSIPSQAIDQEMRSINSLLASLGVKGVVDLKPIGHEEFEADGDASGENDTDMGGLNKLPKDLLKMVGGRITPPMLNVTENSFKDALAGIAERKKELDDRKSQTREAADKIAALMSECPAKEKEKIGEKLGSSLEKLAQCSRSSNFCQGNGPIALEELRSSLRSLELTVDDADISGSLSRGIANCKIKNQQAAALSSETKAMANFADNVIVDCEAVVSDIRSKASAISSINRRGKKATSGSAN